MNLHNSEELFAAACQVLPGGVNSPVRAYRSVGLTPRFIQRAEGSCIYDVEGHRYIDYVCSWGPMILGHNHPIIREAVEKAVADGLSFGAPTPREVEMAQLMVDMVPGLEMVRMVNSGTEAVMSALRLARGATGRDKLIKFEGCYHGHSDCMLVNAGSSALAGGHPSSSGVPVGAARDTLTAQFNDLASVQALLEANRGEVAAVIVEPVAANMGVVGPAPGFLQGLRELCDTHGTLLIFDEVITGFRLAPGGAQEYFGVKADLVTYGKIIGGGMPVGAYGGSRALMEQVAPCGAVYQAGTLSGNPVAMAAGLAQLRYLQANPQVYTHINHMGAQLAGDMAKLAAQSQVPVVINQVGSLISPFFTPTEVSTFVDAKGSDVGMYARYFGEMLQRGIYLAPAQFEAMFLSDAHSGEDLTATLEAFGATLEALSHE
ncbi:glutamate-1-semialdehyde 2,1-aminomutase [Pseudoflavonifractor capillosus]|uniref:glutamate-1-semialdehyde 2,1-aminomutase n=1 Tax=Pseudoflavonifractor capillosus TaxID=106588 RepID=UPI00195EA1C5|nr:glutamate-1-semialdehyde 2,1-aminomutase [Pseudoflavonifractor capillosus]MBM6897325.1 glutamate-1-semialdehyde 2,1-aminomutase [Pseudoflavonifractor capillosus]